MYVKSTLRSRSMLNLFLKNAVWKYPLWHPEVYVSFNQRLRFTYNFTLIRRDKWGFTLIPKCTWSFILRNKEECEYSLWDQILLEVSLGYWWILLFVAPLERLSKVGICKMEGLLGTPIQTCSLWKTDLLGTIYIKCR